MKSNPTSITVFTLFQLMIDFDNNFYWIDIGNFSNAYGYPSTSLLHLSYQQRIVSIDFLWLGGVLRLLGIDPNKDMNDDDTQGA